MSKGADKKVAGRRLKRSDGSIVSVNRSGWPSSSSHQSGKGSSTESVVARPEESALANYSLPPRPRASFEVGLSPIIEDPQSLPSFSLDFDASSMFGGDCDRNVTNGREQDNDSRNFDHMNLSGSFVLQSTSCVDISKVCDSEANEESIPALVLTFPTPEPPKSPIFAPQSPFTAHEFVAAMGPSVSAGSDQCTNHLAVPALPRCTRCGFGFGLDLDDLEAPLSSNPCRLCESQWLECKIWYQVRSNRLREPAVVRPPESNASSRATAGKLGLPVGSHKGLGFGAIDEFGQASSKQVQVNATTAQRYPRFSNVTIKDQTRTTKRTATTAWKKVARLFGARTSSG
ncbi:hypothetical protein C8R45DRAFT_54813 [Mycena sanguinolenta]|nr:hypothetical protein C8R45DRAFT_54813 [Mycena sanguinolenta]